MDVDFMSKDGFSAILEQYRQVYEDCRLHVRSFWELPSALSAINALLIAGSFFLEQPTARIGILATGLLLTIALFFGLLKHEYYYRIGLKTLDIIEEELKLKHVQRSSTIDTDYEYHYRRDAGTLTKYSAVSILKLMVILMMLLLLCLMASAIAS